MKKIYLLLFLLSACTASFASTTFVVKQTNWRWRNDDGGEATATWKAAQNTAITYNGKSVIRLRIEIVNTSTGDYATGSNMPLTIDMNDRLQYSTSPRIGSSWKDIADTATAPFIISGVTGRVQQDQVTTPQLISQNSYQFYTGKMMVSDSVLTNIILPSRCYSEYEWSLKATRKAVAGTTYYFRQRGTYTRGASSSGSTTYPQSYPSLKIKASSAAMDFEAQPVVESFTIGRNTALSVFPNPARSVISFVLNSTTLKQVQAVLTGMDGSVVHQQTFENVQTNTPYKLSLSHPPAPGIYFLKVTGNRLSKISKVMVE